MSEGMDIEELIKNINMDIFDKYVKSKDSFAFKVKVNA